MISSSACHQCGKVVVKDTAAGSVTGRPWKHTFCDRKCYERWRGVQHLAMKGEWLRIQREVWGSTGIGRFQPGKAKAAGRAAEVLARDAYLPAEGFTEIDDFSGYSNQFFADFIATFRGERVLADATVCLNAYVPTKVHLAKALRMRLFIIQISPVTKGLYHLTELTGGRVASRVPAKLIRERAALLAAV